MTSFQTFKIFKQKSLLLIENIYFGSNAAFVAPYKKVEAVNPCNLCGDDESYFTCVYYLSVCVLRALFIEYVRNKNISGIDSFYTPYIVQQIKYMHLNL